MYAQDVTSACSAQGMVFLALVLNFALLSDSFAQTGKAANGPQLPIDFLKKMRPWLPIRCSAAECIHSLDGDFNS
jgi:hypothetical protein